TTSALAPLSRSSAGLKSLAFSSNDSSITMVQAARRRGVLAAKSLIASAYSLPCEVFSQMTATRAGEGSRPRCCSSSAQRISPFPSCSLGACRVHSALLVRELHRELVAVAQAAAALALGAGQRHRRSELDLFGWRGLNGRRDEERCDQGDSVHWPPWPESETLLSYGNTLGE